MDVIEVARLLSDKLSNVLHNTVTDGGRVLGFAGWHASPNGNVVVNVWVSDESKERSSSYRCKISSPDGQYVTEGPLANTLEVAIDGVRWSEIDSWTPFQNSE